MPANLISHILIRPMDKLKIENFYVFVTHWLYRTSRNDVTKRHGIVIIIWRTSAVEENLQSKRLHYQKPTFRNERYARRRIYYGCEGQIEKNPSLGITVWHHSASLVMSDSNPRDRFFYLPLTPMIDSYNMRLIVRKCTLRQTVEFQWLENLWDHGNLF